MLHHYDPINNSLTLLSCLFGLLWLKFCQYIMLFPWFFLCQNEIHFIALALVAGGCLLLQAVRNLSSWSCREQSVCSSWWSSMGPARAASQPGMCRAVPSPWQELNTARNLFIWMVLFETPDSQVVVLSWPVKTAPVWKSVLCLPLVPSDCWGGTETHKLCWSLLWQVANNTAFLFWF